MKPRASPTASQAFVHRLVRTCCNWIVFALMVGPGDGKSLSRVTSFGTAAFEKQFDEIRHVLESHDGPIILSGDLNTWRDKRTQIVADLADSLQLVAVAFDNDQRTRFFGSPLDHIYVRGLRALESRTAIVDTSDHNPMSAILGM